MARWARIEPIYYLILLSTDLPALCRCQVLTEFGHRLQLHCCNALRDHSPVYIELDFAHKFSSPPRQSSTWDWDRLCSPQLYGDQSAVFQEAVLQWAKSPKVEQLFIEHARNGDVNAAWATLHKGIHGPASVFETFADIAAEKDDYKSSLSSSASALCRLNTKF